MENKINEKSLETAALTIDLTKEKSKDREKAQPLLSHHPPLPPTETSNAILHFVSSTSRFLNEFVSVANTRLEATSQKMDEAETQLMLLESKLKSDPQIFHRDENAEAR